MDNDFRKPYEYDDDERGLILVFVIMILAIDILMTIYSASRFYLKFEQPIALRIVAIVTTVLFLIYIIATAVTCYKMKKNLVTTAKRYLIVRTALSICYLAVLFVKNISDRRLVGGKADQYRSMSEMVTWELIVPLSYTFLFILFWYRYFTKSKRFRRSE